MKKKAITLLLTAAMTIGMLAGCSTSNQTSSSATSAATSTSTSAISSNTNSSVSSSGAASVGASTAASTGTSAAESNSGAVSTSPRKVKLPLKIAYVTAGMNTYYGNVLNGIKEEVDRYGGSDYITVDEYSPTSTSTMVEEQITILETLLQDDDLDALFLSVHNDSEFIPYMQQFAEKGVSVYLFNMPGEDVTSDNYVSLVSYNFEEAGKLCGEWIKDNLADEQVKMLYIEGTEGTHNTVRMKGFKEGIAGADNIQIVVSQCGDWTRAGGQTVTENALQSNPEINTVFGPYDEMPLGAITALKGAGKLDSTTVVGYDCTEDGLNAIKEGEMAASVNTDAKQMGVHLIDTCVAHDAEGKEVDKKVMNTLVMIDSKNCNTIPADNYGYTKQEKSLTIEQ